DVDGRAPRDRELALLGRGRQRCSLAVFQPGPAGYDVVVSDLSRHRHPRLLCVASRTGAATSRGSRCVMEPGSNAPAQVVAVALDLGTGQIRDIEPIKHGLTNRSWLVSTAGDRFVVRISDVGSAEDLQIDRDSEAVV